MYQPPTEKKGLHTRCHSQKHNPQAENVENLGMNFHGALDNTRFTLGHQWEQGIKAVLPTEKDLQRNIQSILMELDAFTSKVDVLRVEVNKRMISKGLLSEE